MNKFFGFGLIALIASVSAHAIFIDMIEISDDVSINNNISCTTCNFVGNFVKHEIVLSVSIQKDSTNCFTYETLSWYLYAVRP